MSQTIELKANIRSVRGKAASRLMRREQDTIPGVIYGANKDTVALSLSHKDTQQALTKEGIFSQVLQLMVDGSPEKVIIKALQRHPYKKQILHIDFMRVDAAQILTMSAPLEITGQDKCPGLKAGGILSQPTLSVEVSCLPQNLPESITLDISNMKMGDVMHLSDIQLPKNVSLAHPIEDAEYNHAVCTISEPKSKEASSDTESGDADGSIE